MFESGSSFSEVIHRELVLKLGEKIASQIPLFKGKHFKKLIGLEGLKFIQRVEMVEDALEKSMDPKASFETICRVILAVAPPDIPTDSAGHTFPDHFICVPLSRFVARRTLESENWELGLETLRLLSRKFSSEFALRWLIEQAPQVTFQAMENWVKSPNAHDRRLVSESIRPRLPWAPQLKDFIRDPSPVLRFLYHLKRDDHLYVRRSVANALNDIAKDHPLVVVQTLKTWGIASTPQGEWLARHALRTLIKQGNKDALAFLNVKKANVKVKWIHLTPQVRIGDHLEFEVELKNQEKDEVRFILDYIIGFQKKSSMGQKVFKFKKGVLEAQGTLVCSGRRKLDHFSTRTMYPGKHTIVFQLNGEAVLERHFEVV
jgi:3-methyladenine DNA glycosylase AlkC